MRSLLLVSLFACLAACGQTGDLYLPGSANDPNAQQPAAVETETVEAAVEAVADDVEAQ